MTTMAHRNPAARDRHFRAAALTNDDMRRQPRPEPRRSRTRAARRAAILNNLTQNGL
jgi:hypothetical protein